MAFCIKGELEWVQIHSLLQGIQPLRFKHFQNGKIFIFIANHFYNQPTLFENYSECRIWILAFFFIFCPIKTDLSGNTVWPQASVFQKLAKIDHCWHFLSKQDVNVARFARNVEWDFFFDFETTWTNHIFYLDYIDCCFGLNGPLHGCSSVLPVP